MNEPVCACARTCEDDKMGVAAVRCPPGAPGLIKAESVSEQVHKQAACTHLAGAAESLSREAGLAPASPPSVRVVQGSRGFGGRSPRRARDEWIHRGAH